MLPEELKYQKFWVQNPKELDSAHQQACGYQAFIMWEKNILHVCYMSRCACVCVCCDKKIILQGLTAG